MKLYLSMRLFSDNKKVLISIAVPRRRPPLPAAQMRFEPGF